ncbi:MotA/TolQ/ExbB proton channel family protein [Alcaligenaceae bacterium LF4-65]|uniref:MotA/TolQ/ExbB proton channel family protein n=1 Tax=Zwartia hollandica TaxID=324606 RepID=A0A953T434_9BURK|nr:MotA/TolQ/ExbB proton channel family protein [Zwartia hollandica]MBZ1349357.1 MotA/TolQ/ExbB proton channel family protein [Zwartia hollandica]
MHSIVIQAGWPIWLLILVSIAGMAIVIERSLSLQSRRIAPPELTTQVLQMVRAQADNPEAIEKLRKSSPLGQVLAVILTHRALPPNELRLVVEDAGRDVAFQLERYLAALATVATIAPLMGLFGTVVGMIEIFAAYRPDGSDPTELARGISIALYNTGFGILIAIPAVIAHRHFKTRVQGLLIQLEQAARQVAANLR